MSFRTFVAIGVTAFALLVAPVQAQDAPAKKPPSEKQLAQREKMKNCNAEAKSQSLKGDDRKAFMKTCLSGGALDAPPAADEAPAQANQKEKMKTCNAEAKEKALKGAERKDFMKSCLTAG